MLWIILAFIVGCWVGLFFPAPWQAKAKDRAAAAIEHLRGEFEDEVIDRIKERL